MTAGIIREESGTHFDPVVAAAFLRQQGGEEGGGGKTAMHR